MAPPDQTTLYMRPLVGFAGGMGCGKTTAAIELMRLGFTRIRFAAPLKSMMAALGLTPAEIDGDLKEQPCVLLGGKTPRWAQQTIGTEWGRVMIDPNIWTNAWNRSVGKLHSNQPVVADDVRFANEAVAIRARGGVVVKIIRPNGKTIIPAEGDPRLHASEQFAFDVDHVIHNNGSVQSFVAQIRLMAEALKAGEPLPEDLSTLSQGIAA